MKTTEKNRARSRKAMISFGVTAFLAVTAATAQISTAPTSIDDTGSYQSEVNACMTGKTQQDQATCLKEARNAQADKKRGLLENSSASLQSNALARCSVHSGDDKSACEARTMGYGSVEGSIEGGGVIREVETPVTAPRQ